MKKLFLFLSMVALASFALISCDQDDGFGEEANETVKIEPKMISFKQFKKNTKHLDIEKRRIDQLIRPELYQFQIRSDKYVKNIDSTSVLMIEYKGTTTYSFATETKDGQKANYLLAEKENETKELYVRFPDSGGAEVIDPIDGGTISTQSEGNGLFPCGYSLDATCPSGAHNQDNSTGCCYDFSEWSYSMTANPCSNDYGGGGGQPDTPPSSNNPGEGPNTGGGGNFGSNESGNNLPTDSEEWDIITQEMANKNKYEPCEELEKLSNDETYKNKVNGLNNSDTLSLTREAGYSIKHTKDSLGNWNATYSFKKGEEFDPLNDRSAINYDAGATATIHAHFNDVNYSITPDPNNVSGLYQTFKMPSHTDVINFIKRTRTANSSLSFPYEKTSSTLVSDFGVFNLKIKNSNFPSNINDMYTILASKIKTYWQEIRDNKKANRKNYCMKKFLKALQESGLNEYVGVYRANSNLTSWEEISYDSNRDTIIKTECAND